MARLVSSVPEHTSLFAKRIDLRASAQSDPVMHPYAAVMLLTEGAVEVWSGATYRLRAGDALIIPEGTPHYTIHCERAQVLGVSVCTPCLEAASGAGVMAEVLRAVMRGASAMRRFDDEGRMAITNAFEGLVSELDGHRPRRDVAVNAQLALAAVALHRASVPSEIETPGPGLGARALAFISSHALEGISLADVARHVGRSRTHTSEAVKRQTGRTVSDWIADARLAVARQLLSDTDESVEAVAFRVGFASRSHFHRTFKRLHGQSPTQWRRLHHMTTSGSEDSRR